MNSLKPEGNQNMPPQNMSLWHKDCFYSKAIKKQKELSALPLSVDAKSRTKFSCCEGFPFPSPIPGGKITIITGNRKSAPRWVYTNKSY